MQFSCKSVGSLTVWKATVFIMSNYTTKNKMSLRSLIIKENAPLKLIENPHTGKIFFSCGSLESGYISEKALATLKDSRVSNADKYDSIFFCEGSTDGNNYVPTLYKPAADNTVASLGGDLLR
jgi:hypothetical protein